MRRLQVVKVELFGSSRREYINRNGQPKVAHNLAILTPAGEVGQLYVNEAAYQAAQGLKRGAPVELHVEVGVYNGKADLRIVGLSAV